MDKDLLPLIPAGIGLLGVVIGGFIASGIKYLELRHQRKIEKSKLVLSKLEELHGLVSDYVNRTLDFGTLVVKHQGNNFTIEEFIEMNKILTHPIPRIVSLIRFYSPESETLLSTFTESVNIYIQSGKNFLFNPALGDAELLKSSSLLQYHCNLILNHIEQQSTFYTGLKRPIGILDETTGNIVFENTK